MKQEFSYGAVVYRTIDEKRLYLIEKMRQGHFSLPKGHIEPGETPLECVRREIKEETNLDVSVDTGFAHAITYSPGKGVTKDVTFYLATPTSTDLRAQPEEVQEIFFLSYEEALAVLTHASDKETLVRAEFFLSRRR